VRVKAAAEAERVAAMEAEREAAAERAAHWAAKMDKTLAYRRDVDRRDLHRREAVRCTETKHRLEWHQTLHRQEAVIYAVMAAIEAAMPPAVATEAPCSRETVTVATTSRAETAAALETDHWPVG
jgi:hypothetical protein